jgi:hypothetical protein
MLAEFGRIRPGPALSGALRAERTPHFAWSFSLLQNVDKKYGLLGGSDSLLRTAIQQKFPDKQGKRGNF